MWCIIHWKPKALHIIEHGIGKKKIETFLFYTNSCSSTKQKPWAYRRMQTHQIYHMIWGIFLLLLFQRQISVWAIWRKHNQNKIDEKEESFQLPTHCVSHWIILLILIWPEIARNYIMGLCFWRLVSASQHRSHSNKSSVGMKWKAERAEEKSNKSESIVCSDK